MEGDVFEVGIVEDSSVEGGVDVGVEVHFKAPLVNSSLVR